MTLPLHAVCAVLDAVDKPGAFYASGDVDAAAAAPKLTVPGVGAIALPVTAASAKALIARAKLAPYGHGEETLVDKRVRNTWELNPSEFELNAEWQKGVIDPLAAECARRMGVATPASVQAKLYKLLIYEKGGKFELHQDSEKEPGMFGTLVVLMPSTYQGGALVVYPPGQQNQREGTPHRWRGGYNGASKIVSYAAFYADCEHAVEPVTKGYRICLTYNLVIPLGRRKKPQLAQFDTSVPELTTALTAYFTTPTVKKVRRWGLMTDPSLKERINPRVFTYVLEHKYTTQSLTIDQLKNKDLAIAQRLAQFCANSKGNPVKGRYQLFLCQLSYCFAYDPEYEYEDEDEKERTVHLEGPWQCVDDVAASAGFKTCEVFWKDELAPIGRFDRVKFDSQETHYTGNEGMRRECWYKNAALVVLPQSQVYKQRIASGPQSFIFDWRFSILDGNRKEDSITEAKQFAELAFAKRVHNWHNVAHWFQLSIDTAVQMNDVDVFVWIVRSCIVFEYDTDLVLAKAIGRFGWDVCLPKLFEVMKDRVKELNLRSRANLISSLAATGDMDGVTTYCSPRHIDQMFEHFLTSPPSPREYNINTSAAKRYRADLKIADGVDKDVMGHLLRSASRAASSSKLVGKCVFLEELSPVDVVVPAFVELVSTISNKSVLQTEITDVGAKLRAQVVENLPNPDSWKLGDELEIPYMHCYGCDDCTSVKDFFVSESEHELRMRIAGERRNHVISLVKRHLSEFLTWSLDRAARPHALIVAKKPVNQERRQAADEALAQLEAVFPESSTSATDMTKQGRQRTRRK